MKLRRFFPKFLSKKKPPQLSDQDLKLSAAITNLLAVKINNLDNYKEAFTLKANPKIGLKNYERLEFLGDSVLGSIISCHLYRTYEFANEGFLTQMKSKIVNRQNLNELGERLQLKDYLLDRNGGILSENINGNLFEALVGAIYLDFDYEVCEQIVLTKLLNKDEILKLENKIISYKGLLLEWSQKKKIEITYETIEDVLPNKITTFKSTICVGGKYVAHAMDNSKKKAEEKAAKRTIYTLNKKEKILEKQKDIS